MKKYLVIGNPINHSQSPQLHNFWIKKNNIKAVFEKQKLESSDLKNLFLKIKNKEIEGANVTIPFKNEVISYLDELSHEAKETRSVNTIYLKDKKIIGHNTDIDGFSSAIQDTKFNVNGKKIFIIGAGGVVPSIIFSLMKMNASNIMITNRTIAKVKKLKEIFDNLTICEWGEIPQFDMIINATSVGLNNNEEINLDLSKIENEKFFYDVIYNPKETNFLKNAKSMGNRVENGKRMFIHQAAAAFKIWHGIQPEINDEVLKVLDQ